MQENKILYSDSSYSQETKTASISVYDVTENSYDSKVYNNIKSVLVAETMALKYSIGLAIIRGYDNVVFIYDNLGIDTDSLKEEYKPFFQVIQFVWLKREFLTKVDSCAKRVLQECFSSKKSVVKEKKEVPLSITLPKETIEEYTRATVPQMIDFLKINLLNPFEIEVIDNWINGKKDANKVINRPINYTNYRVIYSLLTKEHEKNNFFHYLKFYYPNIVEFEHFKRSLPMDEIVVIINKQINRRSLNDEKN